MWPSHSACIPMRPATKHLNAIRRGPSCAKSAVDHQPRANDQPGYEILHITGMDEGIANVNNNSYMNMMAVVVLRGDRHGGPAQKSEFLLKSGATSPGGCLSPSTAKVGTFSSTINMSIPMGSAPPSRCSLFSR